VSRETYRFNEIFDPFSIFYIIDNVYEETTKQLKQYPDLEVESLGGGRILHDPEKKSIKVYGYSQGYGKADHQVSVELLKKKYTDYDITYSDDGY
ncbi:ocnus, partial [Vespula maculifrons]